MSSLNTDVVTVVLKFLKPAEIGSARLVSREWKDAADSDVLWEFLLIRDYSQKFVPGGRFVSAFDEYKQYHSTIHLNYFCSNMYAERFIFHGSWHSPELEISEDGLFVTVRDA